MLQLNLKAIWVQTPLFLRGPQSLLLHPSPDQMRPTHIAEGNRLY